MCYNLQLEETKNKLQEVHGYKRYIRVITYNNSRRLTQHCISTTRGTRLKEVQVNTCYNFQQLEETRTVVTDTCSLLQGTSGTNVKDTLHGQSRNPQCAVQFLNCT